MPKIIIFGSSCNPLGNHHIKIIQTLSRIFSGKTIVYPCGEREQKPSTKTISPEHKEEIVRLGLLNIPHISVDYYDLNTGLFTPTWAIDKRYKDRNPNSEIWHAVGGDLVKGGANKDSEIQRIWQRGEEIWNKLNWIVIHHPNCPVDAKDLPPNSELIILEQFSGRSTIIRDKVKRGESIKDLVPTAIEKYILENKLYK